MARGHVADSGNLVRLACDAPRRVLTSTMKAFWAPAACAAAARIAIPSGGSPSTVRYRMLSAETAGKGKLPRTEMARMGGVTTRGARGVLCASCPKASPKPRARRERTVPSAIQVGVLMESKALPADVMALLHAPGGGGFLANTTWPLLMTRPLGFAAAAMGFTA